MFVFEIGTFLTPERTFYGRQFLSCCRYPERHKNNVWKWFPSPTFQLFLNMNRKKKINVWNRGSRVGWVVSGSLGFKPGSWQKNLTGCNLISATTTSAHFVKNGLESSAHILETSSALARHRKKFPELASKDLERSGI